MVPLVILVGTGTSVGKTHVAERILRALAHQGRDALGYKPVESGTATLANQADSDIERLARASSFHVKHPLKSLTLAAPVSPHIAARLERATIDLDAIRAEVARARRSDAALLLVELPGGAFSPLTETTLCADFARGFPDARVLLVAPDRLGVLHDVGAATRACAAVGLPLHGIVLSAAASDDASVATNAAELSGVTAVPLRARLPRAPPDSPIDEGDPAWHLARSLL